MSRPSSPPTELRLPDHVCRGGGQMVLHAEAAEDFVGADAGDVYVHLAVDLSVEGDVAAAHQDPPICPSMPGPWGGASAGPYGRRWSAARFSAHGAFEDPQTPDTAPPRESIEVRTLVFFAD